jgi:hypothetical protein
MCEFHDFLKTGELGCIVIGAYRKNIESILGNPELYAKVRPNIDIWKYGDLELTFDEGKITRIKISLEEITPQLPTQLVKEKWLVNRLIQIENLLDIIDRNKISWQVYTEFSFDRQLCLITEGNVCLFLDLDRREFQSMCVVLN